MATGKVKWFNATKGFGFIAPDDGGKDVFVHITAVKDAGLHELQDDQPVEFDLIEDERRGRVYAGNIKLA
jgi:Cold shock proteins